MTVLSCRGMTVLRGGAVVVDAVDLEIAEQGWLALVGPNGAGKTSLLHALCGLIPSAGAVTVAGLDPGHARRRVLARRVALMPQRPVVPEGITVRQLVALGRTPYLRPFRTETSADRAAVDNALSTLELTGLANRHATTLSGGELQRAILARALTQEAELLLLDEPTSALDIGHQQTVLELVDELRRRAGITVVAAMHDLTLAAQYSTRLVMLEAGRIVADGTPAEVLHPDLLQKVYGAHTEVLERPSGPAVLPQRFES